MEMSINIVMKMVQKTGKKEIKDDKMSMEKGKGFQRGNLSSH